MLPFHRVCQLYVFVNETIVVEQVLGHLYANPTSADRLSSTISSVGFEGKTFHSF